MQGLAFCGGSFRPRQTDRASCEADALPEGCFAIFRKLRKILQRTRIADAMALRAPRCRLCALQGLAPPPHPRESAGRFTPIRKKASQKKGGFAAALQRRVSLKSLCLFRPFVPFARLCSPERQVGHLPSSGTPSGVYREAAGLPHRLTTTRHGGLSPLQRAAPSCGSAAYWNWYWNWQHFHISTFSTGSASGAARRALKGRPEHSRG